MFCWLLARQTGGQFILRLEDTDKKREVAGADQHIIDSLNALGLTYDEGPDKDGPYGPYRQSQRLDSYKKWAQKLVDAGRAYADPYTPEEVQNFREAAQAAKKPFLYRNHRPADPPAWDGQKPLRFKSAPKAYRWQDAIMGELSTGPEVIDDFILIKSDGYPTYNFSHITDDADMKITHVIRGQEFLASVPNYLNLYEALGLEVPTLATVPHILAPQGNKKLSKRDGAKDALEYLKDGFLPDALINFIASLGWNDGTDQEIFSRDELIAKFSLDKVQRSGARFDEKRLVWMNGHYIRELPPEALAQRAADYWPPAAQSADENYKKAVLGLVQERLKFMAELPELTGFFFAEPDMSKVLELYKDPVDKQLRKLSQTEIKNLLQAAVKELEASDFNESDLSERLNKLLERLGSKPGVLFAAIRIAISGAVASPPIARTLNVLGKDRSLARINLALSTLEQ